jgi:hypothetical protein
VLLLCPLECGDTDLVRFCAVFSAFDLSEVRRSLFDLWSAPELRCLLKLRTSSSPSSPEPDAYCFRRGRTRSTDLALSRTAHRGEGDLDISESDAPGLDKDDLVVATGDVGTELRPLEFPGAESTLLDPLSSSCPAPCFNRFLFPSIDVAMLVPLDLCLSPSVPCEYSCILTASPAFPPLAFSLPMSGASPISSSSLLSSCLIDFRILEGEWPSFPGKTIVSASESLFTAASSRDSSGGAFGRSRSIAASCVGAGGDDLKSFCVLSMESFPPSPTWPGGDAGSFAEATGTSSWASIASRLAVPNACAPSWADLLRDTLTVPGEKDKEDHPSPCAERSAVVDVGSRGCLREDWQPWTSIGDNAQDVILSLLGNSSVCVRPERKRLHFNRSMLTALGGWRPAWLDSLLPCPNKATDETEKGSALMITSKQT